MLHTRLRRGGHTYLIEEELLEDQESNRRVFEVRTGWMLKSRSEGREEN